MRQRVERHHVARALLEQQQIGRVLAARINAMAVAADVIVELIVNDRVVRGAIEPDAEPGVEREGVVADHRPVRAYEQQSVHTTQDGVPAHHRAFHVLQIEGGAKPEPFILFVVME